jgi:hypothetical protein
MLSIAVGNSIILDISKILNLLIILITSFVLLLLLSHWFLYFSHHSIHSSIILCFSPGSEFIPQIISLLQVTLVHLILLLSLWRVPRHRKYKLIASRSPVLKSIPFFELLLSKLPTFMDSHACHNLGKPTIIYSSLCLLSNLLDILHLFFI